MFLSFCHFFHFKLFFSLTHMIWMDWKGSFELLMLQYIYIIHNTHSQKEIISSPSQFCTAWWRIWLRRLLPAQVCMQKRFYQSTCSAGAIADYRWLQHSKSAYGQHQRDQFKHYRSRTTRFSAWGDVHW